MCLGGAAWCAGSGVHVNASASSSKYVHRHSWGLGWSQPSRPLGGSQNKGQFLLHATCLCWSAVALPPCVQSDQGHAVPVSQGKDKASLSDGSRKSCSDLVQVIHSDSVSQRRVTPVPTVTEVEVSTSATVRHCTSHSNRWRHRIFSQRGKGVIGTII